MNYSSTNFKKIYFKKYVTTGINNKGEEKKNLLSVIPKGWNDEDFDFVQPWIKSKNTNIGHAVLTGKKNNITVLDFDSMDVYNDACVIYPDLHKHYTVQTRNGRHVYFQYDESLVSSKITKVDLQNNGDFVIGPDTLLKRYNNKQFLYTYVGGKIEKMPNVLVDWACKVKAITRERINFETNIDYNYEVTDEECRSILDQVAEKHREYFDTYSSWITFTAIMKSLDKMDIWDEYSEKYDNGNYDRYKNMRFWKGLKTKISINYFCKLLNIPAMKYHKKVAEDELYNEIIYYEDSTRFVNDKYVNVTYEDFIDHDTVIIESGTGTGKTTCVSKLIRKLKLEDGCSTILSIVNLISLANQQKLTFDNNNLKLKMYNDEKVNPSVIMANDACICINSLWKLSGCNFRNKIVYIDEIYSLCMSLTHNDMLYKQRQIINILYRMVTTCKKLIVSDAHIHNNVMELLNIRLHDNNRTYVHYCNGYQKFNNTPATRYNDENEFYNVIENKVLAGESFSFGSDSKCIIEKWFNKLYAIASVETQGKMFLYTSETETFIQSDWNDKIIFYSPKITTGVDITCINSSSQYMYITGQSVSSINLLQMATRTRNMTQLSYYSSTRSNASLYDSYDDCLKKVTETYLCNELGYSIDDIEDFVLNEKNCNHGELIHMNMYARNSFVLDLHNTNIIYFFEQELKHCGFTIKNSVGKSAKMDKAINIQMNEMTTEIKDEKYNLLLESFQDSEMILPSSISPMKKRCELLNLTTVDEVNEYRELIQDGNILEHFFNYNGLNKGLDFCEFKIQETINNKMIAGVEKNRWFKIKYVHMLGQLCGIENNLFGIDEIIMPELNKKNINIINSIKKLYNKRDTVETNDYDLGSVQQLYKFMLDSLTKKLKLYSSSQCRSRGEDRGKTYYKLNNDNITKYDNLIQIMNTQKDLHNSFDEEEL